MELSQVHAVVDALRFDAPSQRIAHLLDPELLDWCDRRQVTLLLRQLHGAAFPDAVQQRLASCRAAAEQRFARLTTQLFEITDALDDSGIPFVLLKGPTHTPLLAPDAVLRAQGDIDLWCRPADVHAARDVLIALGYVSRPDRRSERRHLAPMARPHNWTWRGDMFDAEMPVHVELHYQLWSDAAEHIAAPGVDEFWSRRVVRNFDGRRIQVLRDEDLVGFAGLHFLMHLLHGDLPLQRAWEIGRFLHMHARDDAFWASWRRLHTPAVRLLEAIAFRVVGIWFGCDVPGCVHEQRLPEGVSIWLDRWAMSPLERVARPNKDELWLQLALIASRANRARVFRRRLFPDGLPNVNMRSARLAHHLRTLAPTLAGAARWLWLTRSKSPTALRAATDPRSTALAMPHVHSE